MRFLNGKTSKANESFFEEEYCLLPDNKLYVQQFNENDISYFKEINEKNAKDDIKKDFIQILVLNQL